MTVLCGCANPLDKISINFPFIQDSSDAESSGSMTITTEDNGEESGEDATAESTETTTENETEASQEATTDNLTTTEGGIIIDDRTSAMVTEGAGENSTTTSSVKPTTGTTEAVTERATERTTAQRPTEQQTTQKQTTQAPTQRQTEQQTTQRQTTEAPTQKPTEQQTTEAPTLARGEYPNIAGDKNVINRYATDTVAGSNAINTLVTKYRNAYNNWDFTGFTASELETFKGVKKALDAARGYTREVDKEKAIHDWLVLNCHYCEPEISGAGVVHQSCYEIDGVFRNGYAVCDGYQKAFLLCMRILGIDCRTVTGTANGGSHAWNVVKIGGEWYQIDCTWDDPIPDQPGKVGYLYFNITDAEIREDHSYVLNDTIKDVICNSTTYSYYNVYVKQTNSNYIKSEADFAEFMGRVQTNNLTNVTAYIEYDFYNDHIFSGCTVCKAYITGAGIHGWTFNPSGDSVRVNGITYYGFNITFTK